MPVNPCAQSIHTYLFTSNKKTDCAKNVPPLPAGEPESSLLLHLKLTRIAGNHSLMGESSMHQPLNLQVSQQPPPPPNMTLTQARVGQTGQGATFKGQNWGKAAEGEPTTPLVYFTSKKGGPQQIKQAKRPLSKGGKFRETGGGQRPGEGTTNWGVGTNHQSGESMALRCPGTPVGAGSPHVGFLDGGQVEGDHVRAGEDGLHGGDCHPELRTLLRLHVGVVGQHLHPERWAKQTKCTIPAFQKSTKIY